jgi:hypothetical protein
MCIACSTTPSPKPVVVRTEIVEIPVPVIMGVPEEYTAPCVIDHRVARTYGDAVDVAIEALDALTACEERMAKIRGLGE